MKKFISIIIISMIGLVFVQTTALSQDQDIYFIAYMNRLQTKVKSNWIIPHGQNDKTTIIQFTIDKNGKLLRETISKESGDQEFDNIAFNAITQSEPFECLPANITDNDITIRFTFNQDNIEAISMSQPTNINVSNVTIKETYTYNPTPTTNNPTITTEVKQTVVVKEQTKDKKTKHKNSKTHKQKVAHDHNSTVTPKTAAAGVLSLIIWPGLGQLVNNGPCEKAGVHAILGFISIFRFWSCYDAIVDRKAGPV